MAYRRFKPQTPFTVPFHLLTPEETTVKGTPVKNYTEGTTVFYCTFRTFGGTEREENGLLSVYDTAVIDTWYTDAIKADCRIKILTTGQVYDIIGTPENILMRNQFLRFKVSAIKGGA